jgi:hypothetical protein
MVRVPRFVAAWAVLVLTLLGPSAGVQATSPREIIARDVEFAFRDAMEMWAYREFWRLWDFSTSRSRFYMSQSDFADQMERGYARPAVGSRIEELEVTPTSPETAVVLARIGLEDPGTNTTRSVVRSFLFSYEDGRWRHELSDFLGLSSYFFSVQPAFGPGVLGVPCCHGSVAPPRPHPVRPVPPSTPNRAPSAGIQQMISPRR